MADRKRRPSMTLFKSPIFSLPDELLEDVLFQAIGPAPNLNKFHHLSATCRRFRQMLLPAIYGRVKIYRHDGMKKIQSFFALTPTYGHLCQNFVVNIPDGNRFALFVGMLCDRFRYFSMLTTLELYAGDASNASVGHIKHWKRLCSVLPSVLQLHINSATYTWEDSAAGLHEACLNMSCVRSLSIQLPVKELSLETAELFHNTFTNIVDVTLDANWPYNPEWISSAFAGRQLTRFTVKDPSNKWHITTFSSAQQYDWAQSILFLIQLNASSLTSLDISSERCVTLAFEDVARNLLHLNALNMRDFDFGNPDKFETIMRPFLECPLRSLFIACRGIPETFHTWFDPDRKLWPGLKILYLEVDTYIGPGDEAWDNADPEERGMWVPPNSDFDMWTPQSRTILASHCSDRGIMFRSYMRWLEGYN